MEESSDDMDFSIDSTMQANAHHIARMLAFNIPPHVYYPHLKKGGSLKELARKFRKRDENDEQEEDDEMELDDDEEEEGTEDDEMEGTDENEEEGGTEGGDKEGGSETEEGEKNEETITESSKRGEPSLSKDETEDEDEVEDEDEQIKEHQPKSELIIPREHLRKFYTELKHHADSFEERFAAGEDPRWDQIKMLRDFLLLMAMLSGAPRSCVLTNMTGEEVANATNCSGKRVIKVGVHKTARVYGKAQVIIREDQWKYFTMYDEVRHLSPGGSQSVVNMQAPFFLSSKGKGVNKPSTALNESWKDFGLPGKISSRAIRKTVVTAARDELSNEERQRIASFMCHSIETADHYYAARYKTSQNIECRDRVWDMLVGEEVQHYADQQQQHNLRQSPQHNTEATESVESPNTEAAENVQSQQAPLTQHLQNKTRKPRSRFRLTSSELEDMERTVRAVLNRTCFKTKNPKFRDITDEAYPLIMATTRQKMSRQQFYDKARNMGLRDGLW
ncbi:uncharacterized protein LOC100892106 [Strongylocentrotus purpuratus]|uniref:Uncharacterized protein n=2 Tax=Strongylocentrotus purpuratus TaxID=7668 RepID=A0A7M7NQP1_STRPU|nr:uncharacterized protein LOC100892106 [Strongylocentrotus purpuratus]